jgi:hypothetical protein
MLLDNEKTIKGKIKKILDIINKNNLKNEISKS